MRMYVCMANLWHGSQSYQLNQTTTKHKQTQALETSDYPQTGGKLQAPHLTFTLILN